MWLARDEDGSLVLFEKYPRRSKSGCILVSRSKGRSWTTDSWTISQIPKSTRNKVKWESKPMRIEFVEVE